MSLAICVRKTKTQTSSIQIIEYFEGKEHLLQNY